MSLTLPFNFNRDIQGRNTNLFPIVVIGNYANDNWTNAMDIISTNALSFRVYGMNTDAGIISPINSIPILLNVPSLKESIDIEKRNYKISNVNLDISNLPYEGERFSERVSLTETAGSLINVECRIFWVSPGSDIAYPEDNSGSDSAAMQVYFGIIRKYTHDDEKVRLVLEDRSQAYLHRDLPNKNAGALDNVPDKDKNNYVPMVYGEVDRSPLIAHNSISEEITTDQGTEDQLMSFRLKAETEAVTFIETGENLGGYNYDHSPLYFYENGSYHNVYRTKNELGTEAGPENFYWENGGTDIVMKNGSIDLENDSMEGKLRLRTIRKFNKIESVWTGGGWIDPVLELNQGVSGIGRITGVIDCSIGPYSPSLLDWSGGHFKCYLEPLTTPSNMAVNSDGTQEEVKSTLLINATHYNFYNDGHVPGGLLPNTFSEAAMISTGSQPKTHWAIFNGDDTAIWWGTVSALGDGLDSALWHTSMLVPNSYNNISGGAIGDEFYGMAADDLRWWTGLADYDHINIGIPKHAWNVLVELLSEERIWGVDFHLHDAFVIQAYRVSGISDKDYYANVIGRTDSSGTLLNRVPSIIGDILENELGADNIVQDPTIYEWQYDFTVHKKINSKKLIEGLASASPFVPRFDNMGNFKFDTIKGAYYETNLSAGFTDYKLIKAEDVINSSFSRTSIDEVYTRIELQYGWDYGSEKFNKRTIWQILQTQVISEASVDLYGFWNIPNIGAVENTYSHAYYGLKDDGSESTLVIDDTRGKFIRDDTTADNFAKWMLRYHANQHLKMKVRLPLKYMYLEVGNIVRFDKIIDVKPYGIDYSKDAEFYGAASFPYYGSLVNGQQAFPDFMCTSTNKTLEYCEIECIQMHNLSDNPRIAKQISGCMNPAAWNYNELAQVEPDGACIIPPSFNESGAMLERGNTRFDDMFLQDGFSSCPYLMPPGWEINWSEIELYYNNYPPPDSTIFADPNYNYGDDIVPEIPSEDGTPPRYFYDNLEHITAAKTFWKLGYDELTGTSGTGLALYYPAMFCTLTDIKEPHISTVDFNFFGMGYGGLLDTGPTTSPVGVTLYTEEVVTNGQVTSWQPNYNQSISGDYPGAGTGWDFHYVPLPLWNYPGTPHSITNDLLKSQWISAGSPDGQYGNLILTLSNIRFADRNYNPDGSPIGGAAVGVQALERMEVLVASTGFVYNTEYVDHWGATHPASTGYDFINGISADPLIIDYIPNLNETFNLSIGGLGIKHTPPAIEFYPDDLYLEGTENMHENHIWTIYLQVVTYGTLGIMSNVTIRLRFGITDWGGPASLSGYFG